MLEGGSRGAELRFLRGDERNRFPIGRIVSGGFESVPVTRFPLEVEGQGLEIELLATDESTEKLWAKRWNDLKVERNGLTALFTEEVWQKVNGIRRGLIEKGRPRGFISGVAEYPVRDDPIPLVQKQMSLL